MAQNTLLERVLSLQDKFQSLQDQLASPEVMSDMKKYVQLNKDYKQLEPIIKAGLEYKKTLDNLASAKDILVNEKDDDLREMAREEIAELEPKIPQMEDEINSFSFRPIRMTRRMPSSKFVVEQVATKPPSSQVTFSVCISIMPRARAGNWK